MEFSCKRRGFCPSCGARRMAETAACQLVGQNRTTQRNRERVIDIGEYKLRLRLREIARSHVRWGRSKAYQLLRREGWEVNHKRVQRLWREEGLQRPTTRKRKRAQAVGGSRELLR